MDLSAENHRLLINGALRAARRLAETYYPVTDAQILARADILQAVDAGDLRQVKEAMRRAAFRLPKSQLATREWAQTARVWRALVETTVEKSVAAQERAA